MGCLLRCDVAVGIGALIVFVYTYTDTPLPVPVSSNLVEHWAPRGPTARLEAMPHCGSAAPAPVVRLSQASRGKVASVRGAPIA